MRQSGEDTKPSCFPFQRMGNSLVVVHAIIRAVNFHYYVGRPLQKGYFGITFLLAMLWPPNTFRVLPYEWVVHGDFFIYISQEHRKEHCAHIVGERHADNLANETGDDRSNGHTYQDGRYIFRDIPRVELTGILIVYRFDIRTCHLVQIWL